MKTLAGSADFDVAFDLLGGSTELSGLVDVGAKVTLGLTFGFDCRRVLHLDRWGRARVAG